MSTVSINAKLLKDKRAEFYLTLETLKKLIEKNCEDFDYKVNPDDTIEIKIKFKNEENLKRFDELEFSILKGGIRSLCTEVKIDTSINISN